MIVFQYIFTASGETSDLQIMGIVFAGVGVLLAASSAFADPCRVMDPELAGEYVGGCHDGLSEGYGTAAGASFYQGQFHNGKKHGIGVKVWANGDRYEGGFREDMKEGLGRYSWGAKSRWAGDSYVGEYRNDKRYGQGVYEWANGDRYEGLWKDDLRYGPSAMEIQKQRAQTAWMAAVGKPGTVVCSELSQGLVLREKVRGKVERVVGDQVEVSIAEFGNALPGQTVRRIFSDWRLCD